MRKEIFTIAFVCLSISSCFGANFLINVSGLGDGMGGAAPAGGTLIGVASLTDSSFADPPVGDFVASGGDDVVLFSKALTGNGSLTGTTGDLKFADHADFDSSDPVRLVWFPSITAPLDTPSRAPMAGDRFLFSTDTATLANDTDAFNTVTFNFGDISGAQSSGTLVPEPSTSVLFVLGGLSVLARRRRS